MGNTPVENQYMEI